MNVEIKRVFEGVLCGEDSQNGFGSKTAGLDDDDVAKRLLDSVRNFQSTF